MNRIYDASQVADLISDIEHNISVYQAQASDLYAAMQAYINNEQFRGEDAEASKRFMSEVELTLLEKIVEAQDNLLSLYKHMQEKFHASVDESIDAHIETESLLQVKYDFTDFCNRIYNSGSFVERMAADLQRDFSGATGVSFTQINFDAVRESGRAIIGGGGSQGFIDECIEKFEDFDVDETSYANSMDYSGYIEKISQEIDSLNEKLSRIVVLNPNIDFFSLLLLKFQDKGLAIKKLLKQAKTNLLYMLGNQKSCSVCLYDPVNLCTGNYINEKVDLSLKGRYPLEFKRFYNALSTDEGFLGLGWNHSFEKRIYEEKGQIKIDYPDGSKGSFAVIDERNHLYMEEHGQPGILEDKSDGYILRQDSGVFESYDYRGYLVAMGDNDGENISLSYEESKSGKRLLSKVEAKYKNSLTFSYYDDDKNLDLIKSVTDQSGRSVCFVYENRKLTEVTEPDGATRKYAYSSDNRIKYVVNPKGITAITNEYDIQGRIIKQSFPDNTSMTYEYDDEKMITVATEQNGNKVTYSHDELNRHVKTSYYDGEESYTYNYRNLKTSFTDKRGNTTRFAYDDRGHLTKIVDAKGNKTSITYRADGKPMSVKGAKGEVYKYTYGTGGKLFEIRNPLGETNRFYYSNGNLEQTRNAAGALTSFTYDERGNVNTITDPDGVVTEYEYDKLNRVVKTITADGAVTKYEYDDADRITRTTDALSNTREYTYDEMGKVVAAREADGTVKNFEINVMGRVSKIVDEAGNVTEITYNVMGKQEEVCLPNGGVIKYEYDPLMRLKKITDPEGRTIGYDYDANGNVVAEYLGDVKVRSLEYDALNQVVKEIDAMGHTKTYEYDENGNVVAISDTNGNKTIRQYDLLGRVTKEIDALGNETSYSYTKLGDIETITDSVGRVRKYEYTDAGKLKVIYFCETKEQELAYDNVGRVAKRTFADGYELSYSYDVLSRIAKVEGSDGRVVAYEYDAMGRTTKVMDGRSTTFYTYTPTGRLKSVVDALGNETAYTYDSLDNLKSIQRAEGKIGNVDASLENFPTVGKDGHVTIYDYDLSGQLTKVTDALGQVETYEYDQYGRLVSKTDRDNYTTTYGYNALGAVTNVGYADGKTVAFAYNELNQLNEIIDWLGKTTLENDVLGRILKVTDYKGRTVAYEYGKSGERTKIVYSDGREAIYNYDEKLNLTSIVGNGQTTTYDYDELGRLVKKLLPNNVSQAYTYLPGGNLESMESFDDKGQLDKYFYTYDNSGLISGIDRDRRDLDKVSGKYSYQYDAIGRLVQSSLNGQVKSAYEYDAFGNRTSLVEDDVKTLYTYDILDRLTEVKELNSNSQAIVKTYEYDKRGNQTKEYVDGFLQKTFAFDATNMLKEVVDSNLDTLQNEYNGLGFRVASTKPDENIEYLCDLSRDYYNLLERTVNGETESFIYDSNVVSMSKAGRNYYYLQDELGSPMYLTGTDGTAVSTYAFDDFGRNIDTLTGQPRTNNAKQGYDKQGNIIQPFAFTGYQEDEISGLKFAQARFYDADKGRFVGEDQVRGYIGNPDTINHYLYCRNKSVNCIDRNGKNEETKDRLLEELSAVTNNDLSLVQKGKDCFYSNSAALDKVLELDEIITDVSNKYDVEKEMIQSIMFREIRCYGLDDPVADTLVQKSYSYEEQKEDYIEWSNSLSWIEGWKLLFRQPPDAVIGYRLDSSTGIGQIFAKTAIKSYNEYYHTDYDSKNWKDLKLFWNKLQEDEFNTEMVALILKSNANEFGYDINNLSSQQLKEVLARYNGTNQNAKKYGDVVREYYYSFKEYANSCD